MEIRNKLARPLIWAISGKKIQGTWKAMHDSILITGGAGFIDSHGARTFLANTDLRHHRLVVLGNLQGGFRENEPQDQHP